MSLFATWLASSAPDAAIEIAPEGVSVALLGSRGSDAVLQAYGSAELPPGAVTPSLSTHNIVDRAAVVEALRTACERAGQRPRRAALVIPDLAARVSLVRFDNVPAKREDLAQLIRWQVKKASPFPVDDACVTYSAGARTGAGGEFVVVAARRETIREYEAVCDGAGIYAGLVDLATLSVVNLYLSATPAPTGDWLVVHMRRDYTSIAIMRGDDLIFFRNSPESDHEPLADLVHQTAMYYQDRLSGAGFTRVFAGGLVDSGRRDLESLAGGVVEPIDPSRAVTIADRAALSPEQRRLVAPLIGMLLRARREALAA